MSTGAPGTDASAQGATGRPSGKFWAVAGLSALLVGVGGFFLGSAVKAADYDKGQPAYNKIYAAGFTSGQQAGNAAGKQAGQASGKRLGVAQGLQVGKKAGEAAGQKTGYSTGYTAGVTAGASEALGTLGAWNTDVPYVVELNPSSAKGVPYQIYSRTLMLKGFSYFLCPDGKTACNTKLPG
ncbi:MAG: hypothetical protein F2799_07705 [Actinobacteria bacterium]|uniref:Unannotated protein n=1 Tax=freshwater metagenome TaxID=449393 RepID=A0A6J7EIY6_9ZZZZ|nr:hypothetical protein [Actinomycetota bacterium]